MHDSKICFKCNIEQPLSEFYKHKMMADGHLNKCKTCTKNDAKENTLKNPEYYKEYDIIRNQLPHRKEYKKKANDKWKQENVIKRAASLIVNNHVRDGKLMKPDNCSICGIEPTRLHGHHDDYAKPLSVRWLCPKCHTAWHKINKPINCN
jgi:hypothetical protein